MKKQQDLAPSKQCQGARVSGAHGAPAAGRGAAPTETRSGGTAGCTAWECNIAGAASPQNQGCWKVSLITSDQ